MWWIVFVAVMLSAAAFVWGAGLGFGMIACGIASVALFLAPRGGSARAEPAMRPVRLIWLAPLAGVALGLVISVIAYSMFPPPT